MLYRNQISWLETWEIHDTEEEAEKMKIIRDPQKTMTDFQYSQNQFSRKRPKRMKINNQLDKGEKALIGTR